MYSQRSIVFSCFPKKTILICIVKIWSPSPSISITLAFHILMRLMSGNASPSVDHDDVVLPPSTLRLSKSFGRLKAVKIRSVVRKASKEKQKANEDMYEEPNVDDLDDDDDDDGEIASLDPRDVFIKKRKNTSVKSGIEQLMDSQSSMKPFESDGNLTRVSSKVSFTHSERWNNREMGRSSRVESRDLKPTRKYNAGSEFFSRKSFRELGCSDDMVVTLRALDFVSPSHIQVSFHTSCLFNSVHV